eukprot:3368014-Alexandrium_andersonii.AAC.1
MARHTPLDEVCRAFRVDLTLPQGWFSAALPANEAYLRFLSPASAALALQRIHVRIAGRYLEVFRAYREE